MSYLGRYRILSTLFPLLAAAVFLGSSAQTASAGNIRVAVLYFDNNTGDREFDVLKKGMADMLITDLSQQRGVTVVERSRLQALLAELKLQKSRYINKKTAVKLGRGLGASHAITGSFTGYKSKVRIDVRLLSVSTGKVLAAKQVTGKKSEFFDLEQQLAKEFSCALNRSSCGSKSDFTDPGVNVLLKYARGLEQEDRGNLKKASTLLKGVVTSSPTFRPATASYRRILKRLYDAKARRTDVLGESHRRLLQKIARVRSQDRLTRVTRGSDEKIGRWIGYRVLKGQLALRDIDQYFITLSKTTKRLNKKHDKKFAALVRAYYANQMELIADLDRFRRNNRGRKLPDCTIDEPDQKIGEGLGLGDEAGELSFYSVHQIARDLGTLIITGTPPFWGTFRFSQKIPLYTKKEVDSRVRIGGNVINKTAYFLPIHRINKQFASQANALFDSALKRIPYEISKDSQQQATIETLDAHATALTALKRPEHAIAKWQDILDRYPAYEDYKEIETKIRATLGR